MSRPVALLSDFGYRDAYVGVLRAVILSRSPASPVFDLTHGIPAGDVMAGALQLASAAPFCPAQTVFVAVVDPGVGSDRRAICIRSAGRLFLGPDNGLLWPAAAALDTPECFHISQRLAAGPVSATFHGRDVFAPAAALLALNRAAEDLGPPIRDAVRLVFPPASRAGTGISGEVLYIDGFGSAVTNIRPTDLDSPAQDSV